MLHLRLGPVLTAEHPIHRAPPPAPKPVPTAKGRPGDDPDTSQQPCLLLELLPNHLLLHIVGLLDVFSRCVLSQTCRSLLQLCGTPSLWPQRRLGGPLVQAVRSSLSTILRVPPQIFNVRIDDGRSAKFPLSVPLHNLRFVLGAGDVETLAERAAGSLQDWISRVPVAAHYRPASAAFGGGCGSRHCPYCAPSRHAAGSGGCERGGGGAGAGAEAEVAEGGVGGGVGVPAMGAEGECGGAGGGPGLPASAALMLCRADRGFVRLGLRPGVAVARVLAAADAATALPPRWARPAAVAAVVAAAAAGGAAAAAGGLPFLCVDEEAIGHTVSGAPAAAANEAAVAQGLAAGAVAAAGAAAAAADEEVAQLRLLELALAGVPFAREAWRAFATGCNRVASARISDRSLIAAAGAPFGPGVSASVRLPQGTCGPGERSSGSAGESGGASEAAAGAQPQRLPPVALEVESPAGDVGPAAKGGRGAVSAHSQHPHAHRHSICGLLPQLPTASVACSPSELGAGPSPATTCVSLRLRLVALMTRGWGAAPAAPSPAAALAGTVAVAGGGSGAAAVAGAAHAAGLGMVGGAHAAAAAAAPAGAAALPSVPLVTAGQPQPPVASLRVELESALMSSCSVAVAYGKLLVAVGAVRSGWRREMAAHGRGSSSLEPRVALPAQAGAATAAPLNCIMDAAVAATGSDALLCLTTFETLLEVRAAAGAVAAAAAAAAAASAAAAAVETGGAGAHKQHPVALGAGVRARYGAGSKWEVALSPHTVAPPAARVSAAVPGGLLLQPGTAAQTAGVVSGSSGDGNGGSDALASDNAAGLESPAWTQEVPTVASVVRDLCGLLVGTLAPAVARLLEPPRARYSPLGMLVGGGEGGGVWGDAEAAGRSLARVAMLGADGLEAREQREALRALLLLYMEQSMAWALALLGCVG